MKYFRNWPEMPHPNPSPEERGANIYVLRTVKYTGLSPSPSGEGRGEAYQVQRGRG